jgi:hypothetical protein
VPHTHRVVIRSEGQAVPAMLIGPVSKLPTRWKLIVANLPHDRLAEYRGFDENGELIWSQVAPSAGIEP